MGEGRRAAGPVVCAPRAINLDPDLADLLLSCLLEPRVKAHTPYTVLSPCISKHTCGVRGETNVASDEQGATMSKAWDVDLRALSFTVRLLHPCLHHPLPPPHMGGHRPSRGPRRPQGAPRKLGSRPRMLLHPGSTRQLPPPPRPGDQAFPHGCRLR